MRNNIKVIYETTRNYVRKGREQSEKFATKKGLGQGGVSNFILFIMIVDDDKVNQSKVDLYRI